MIFYFSRAIVSLVIIYRKKFGKTNKWGLCDLNPIKMERR